MPTSNTNGKTALVVGASRAIGLALAVELLNRGWNVVVTVRSTTPQTLLDLTEDFRDRLTVEHLDITEQTQIYSLRERLATNGVDLLFVNAGTTNDDQPVGEVTTEDFVKVMITNALSPMRVIEGLKSVVPTSGTIGVMSSRQGSISMNTRGGHEIYRASKSALNQLMRSYASRHHDDPRTLLLIHPGWVKTDLGGAGAQLEVVDSARGVVDVLESHEGDGGLQFLDYQNDVVYW